ncbi:hypothetical protein CISIN_1g041959mg [Citrus sinensis]|uniref:NADP-dependent oxidoreductase domain-containing protein n=1 Tax=Citrus sinensis TaxID=2711 RepID=A0A067DPB7_CITSI|nr:hypothetical protein CISIN_1g041959mg [Citrus sinensis]
MRTAIPEEPLGSTGKSIPLVGFGTVEYPLNEAFKERVLHAIKLGYRHFDTAAAYPSEQPLGEALAEALRLASFNPATSFSSPQNSGSPTPIAAVSSRAYKKLSKTNPIWQQKKLREYRKEKGIHFSACSPLGAVGTNWGHNRVMENEVLKQIAEANGKTVAQLIHNSFFLST